MATMNISAGRAIDYGWASVKKDFWYFVGIAVIMSILTSIGSTPKEQKIILSLISFVISAWLTNGYLTLMLSYQAGKKLPISTLFSQSKQMVSLMGASILVGLIVGLGFFLFIIPGIYLALKYQFTEQLIVDKHLSITDAMKESARITSGKKMSLLGFNFVCLGVALLGVLALGVGIFVAIPVIQLAMIDVYRKLVDAPVATSAVTA